VDPNGCARLVSGVKSASRPILATLLPVPRAVRGVHRHSLPPPGVVFHGRRRQQALRQTCAIPACLHTPFHRLRRLGTKFSRPASLNTRPADARGDDKEKDLVGPAG